MMVTLAMEIGGVYSHLDLQMDAEGVVQIWHVTRATEPWWTSDVLGLVFHLLISTGEAGRE